MPVTTSNSGRDPDSDHPVRNPAQYAPYAPPPDSTSTDRFGNSTAGRRLARTNSAV